MDFKEVSAYEGPDESPGYLLWTLSNAWQRAIRAALAPHDLTHVQFVLLACLTWWESTGRPAPTQRALADRAGADVMMASQVLRTLEKANLIARSPHPEDTRALTISLTEQGRVRAQAAFPSVEAADRAFFTANRKNFQRLT